MDEIKAVEAGSLLQQMANKISNSEKGVINGVASLGADGKVPAGQLPPIGGGV